MTFRFADENDCSVILSFIKALADYEKMTEQVVATEEPAFTWRICLSSRKRLAQITMERGCGRLEWACLDWSQPSIDFYRSLGAVPMDEWTTYRLTGDTLKEMAE